MVRLLVDQDFGLHEQRKHLRQDLLADASRINQLVEAQGVEVIVLRQHRHLVGTCHEDVLLVQIVRPQFILAVVPKPCELTSRVLRLVIVLEPFVCRQDVLRDMEIVRRRAQRPEVRSENHNAERQVAVFRMRLLHTSLELVREILTERHI